MDQDIPLINSHANNSRSCISVSYNMSVLCLLLVTTFFSSFTCSIKLLIQDKATLIALSLDSSS